MTPQLGRNGEHDVACRSLVDALLGHRQGNTSNLDGLLDRICCQRSDHPPPKMFH
jgi:hypothetical protein